MAYFIRLLSPGARPTGVHVSGSKAFYFGALQIADPAGRVQCSGGRCAPRGYVCIKVQSERAAAVDSAVQRGTQTLHLGRTPAGAQTNNKSSK